MRVWPPQAGSQAPNRTLALDNGYREPPAQVLPAWASPPETSKLVMLGDSSPEASGALRVIRHRLEQKRPEGLWVFGVTSARDGEGKTTFAAQLALVLSEAQRARVLLVEANFARPTIAKLLGFKVPPGQGFSSQLLRRMRGVVEPLTVTALGPALHVLAEASDEEGFPETLHSTQFHQAIAYLARGYDFVVVDSPSVLGSGDANVVEDVVHGMLVVARSKVSRGSELRAALRQLGEDKTLGSVLWDASPAAARKAR